MWALWSFASPMQKFKLDSQRHVMNRHNSDTRAVLNFVNTVGNNICVHYYNDMTLMAQVHEYVFGALLDTGCNRSNISLDMMRRLKMTNSLLPPEVETFKMASGQTLKAMGCVDVPLVVKGCTMPFRFHVLRDLSHDMILGTDFLSKYGAQIDFTDTNIKFTRVVPVAPVLDTKILPKETALVRAKVAVSDNTVHPFITITDCGCTIHDGTLCLLVTNETEEEVVLKYDEPCAEFTPIDVQNVSLLCIQKGKVLADFESYGVTEKEVHDCLHYTT